MPQQLIEGIVDRLLAYYEANLPAKVAALNTEYSDSFKLKAPQPNCYYAGERPLKDSPDYPKLFVLGDRMNVLRYSGGYTDADHEVTIMVAVRRLETDYLQREMYRWGRALWELLVARFFAGSGDDYFALSGDGDISIEYERPEVRDGTLSTVGAPGGPYVGIARLTATFNKQEAVA